MRLETTLAGLALSMAMAGSALAQGYPNRPIRLILPQAPGGGSDLVARAMGPEIEKRLGQPFIIENKPGGNESIGPDIVAKAPPDGYTIGVVSSTFSINQTSVGPQAALRPAEGLRPGSADGAHPDDRDGPHRPGRERHQAGGGLFEDAAGQAELRLRRADHLPGHGHRMAQAY